MFAFAAAMMVAQVTAAAIPVPPPNCDAPEYAAFDFWIGEWDVFPAGKDTQTARSRVEKLYGGCAIRENWMPLRGAGGGSLSGYDPTTHRWRQTWIGSTPGVIQFEGGSSDGKMALTGSWPGSGPNGEDGLIRMTYSRVQPDAVRQFGEFSADNGENWVTSFDLIYRPHRESAQ